MASLLHRNEKTILVSGFISSSTIDARQQLGSVGLHFSLLIIWLAMIGVISLLKCLTNENHQLNFNNCNGDNVEVSFLPIDLEVLVIFTDSHLVINQSSLFPSILLINCGTVSNQSSVTYDNKAIIINGQRRILFSGSIHYPRSVPEMWPDLIQKAKDGGVNVIQTYVFWNGHEPSPGNYYFEDRYDLVGFVKQVKQAGLYVHLRIGPYVCAEWNFGGFPVWLKYVPGISFRTDNEAFKTRMAQFSAKIVDMMKAADLFEWQGGPIILAQIENEFGPLEYNEGAPAKSYSIWAAKMAIGLETGVPWLMCKQNDAIDPIIDTCNGFYCDYFSPNKPYKPKIWTEAWTGWYTSFGDSVPHRPVEDLAFSVARFIQKGGSYINYYMYHGGTNFDRTAGGPFVATSYDYDAPIDEYGLVREPKWSHLRELHRTIMICEPVLLEGAPVVISLGKYQESYVFRSKEGGGCVAFLSNYDHRSYAKLEFNDQDYLLPPWSISILPDCKNIAFNTAMIGGHTFLMKMQEVAGGFSWESYSDETTDGYDPRSTTTAVGLLEQINMTRDSTDYLWYTTYVDLHQDELFLMNDGMHPFPTLTVMSAGHSLHVFVNGEISGTTYGSNRHLKLTYTGEVKLQRGRNKISILSVAVGLPNLGKHFETWNVGILGPVVLNGLKEGKRDLTWQNWTYQVGLRGEHLNFQSPSGTQIEWVKDFKATQPLTWYKSSFVTPEGDDPLALDMNTMGKGLIWINGRSIGRYWPGYKVTQDHSSSKCTVCDYVGRYNKMKCNTNCGESSQRWYHVPRSWLKPAGNIVVVFEEWGGDPTGISLVKRIVGSVCADVLENQPSEKKMNNGGGGKPLKAHLRCGSGQKISKIEFASYGTPKGVCGDYKTGSCHAEKSYRALEHRCIGLERCSVNVVSNVFGGDPCSGYLKKLSVQAICQ